MPIRVMVNGAQGKMGTLACETFKNHPDFALVGCLTRQDDLRQAIAKNQAEIVVDLTRPDSVYENSLRIIESDAHPVIGTSGLNVNQIEELKKQCQQRKLGGLIVPNFSIAAILMMRFAAEAAHYFSEVEIIEMHHQQKIDAPSGTAIKTAEMIAKARQMPQKERSDHEIISGVRGGKHQGISIHSLRLPGTLAEQQVIFGSTGETLTIHHNSIDRLSFMPGIILSCQRVRQLDGLHYGLETVLF